jgi:hypothetical protein
MSESSVICVTSVSVTIQRLKMLSCPFIAAYLEPDKVIA